VHITGYAGLKLEQSNDLGLGVLSNTIRVENLFPSEATDLAGLLNWNWDWNSILLGNRRRESVVLSFPSSTTLAKY
jgi:hypothetical protein